ncbi:MAG: 2,4'-dihydroxyacetophenone dioxygenase family protein [Pseudomonadota bacterium]
MNDARALIENQVSIVPTPMKEAAHIGVDSNLPYVDLGDGSELQLLQVDLDTGLWISKVRFAPGCTIDRHYHTGSVYAVTLEGCWHYLEYPGAVNRAGSYLFEPAGSVHTLTVPEDSSSAALVWFAVNGANVNIDNAGQVSSIVDAATVLSIYSLLAGDADLSELLVSGEPRTQ